MDKRKIIAAVTVVLVLIAACVITIPVRREIDQDFTCYACHYEDANYRQEVTVTFTGTYVDYLFLPDHFEGYIHVSPFDYMTEAFVPGGSRELDLTLRPDDSAHIIYTVSEASDAGKVDTYYAARGMIRADEDLRAFQLGCFILVSEDSNSSTMDVILSYPESLSWEEALASLSPG